MKKSTKTGQDDKTKENAGTRGDEKEKKQHKKNFNTTWGKQPESPDERRKIKEISTKGKTIQTK